MSSWAPKQLVIWVEVCGAEHTQVPAGFSSWSLLWKSARGEGQFHEGMADGYDIKPGSCTSLNMDPADGDKTEDQADFVLIWSQPQNIQNKSPEQKTQDENEKKRKAYFERLKKTGLHVGYKVGENHATIKLDPCKEDDIKLLQQYAEILKMRMPLAEELRWGNKKIKVLGMASVETFLKQWLGKETSSKSWRMR